MRRSILLISLLLILAACTGCAQFGTYMKNRGNDLIDCFGARCSGGLGLLFNVRATQEVQAGIGLMYVGEGGFIGRRIYDWRDNLVFELGLPLLYYIRAYRWGGLIEPKGGATKGVMYTIPHDDDGPCSISEFDRDWDRQFFDIGLTVHVLFIGVNFEFRTKEFLDFLLGWTTLDITSDDAKPAPEPAAPDNPPAFPESE